MYLVLKRTNSTVASRRHARNVIVLRHDAQLVVELLHSVTVRTRGHLLNLPLLLEQLFLTVSPLRIRQD